MKFVGCPASHLMMGLEAFLQRFGIRKGEILSALQFYMFVEVLVSVIRQAKEIKFRQIGKEEISLSQFTEHDSICRKS